MTPRTIKLNEFGITYTETGDHSLFLNLVVEQDGNFGFYAVSAHDQFSAVTATAQYGKVVYTISLMEALYKLDTRDIDEYPDTPKDALLQ